MAESLLLLQELIRNAIEDEFGVDVDRSDISIGETKKEYDGHYTWVAFPFAKVLKMAPAVIARRVGESVIKQDRSPVRNFNVIQGFLNLEMHDHFWTLSLGQINKTNLYGTQTSKGQKVLVEFASPNTNKPIHLGHIRNILLGWSTSKILAYCGYDVIRTQIINDRGIAICKSMLAWQKYGKGERPGPGGMKGDHLVGKYYIRFEKEFAQEYAAWQTGPDAEQIYLERKDRSVSPEAFFKAYKNEYFNEHSQLGKEAKDMLLSWEAKDEAILSLWRMMNQWVYDGFEATYDALGVEFDSVYYESDTYLLGKDIIQQGLESGHFYRQEDGSVWVDLEDAGLDKKILLRSDGTSVYMTQDLGTAQKRYMDYGTEKMIYVVADEQDYHFKVLFEILKKLGEPYAEGLYHLSYGMVDLPSGRMKSREGTVVDADDLIAEVVEVVRKSSCERGELDDLDEDAKEDIYEKIAMAALKFFILKVNPRKRMTFNPEESVDIQGQTGPYIQNAYVRIQSVLRKLDYPGQNVEGGYESLDQNEIELIRGLLNFPGEVEKAAAGYDPSVIANYAYDLAKKFHKFYHEVRILNADTHAARNFRLKLSRSVADVLEKSMNLLGIQMPERM